MQRDFGRFEGQVRFDYALGRQASEWRFFFRDFFTMFLRWHKPIELFDGTLTWDHRLMRRKVRGRWQYRLLNEAETAYIVAIENGTHC